MDHAHATSGRTRVAPSQYLAEACVILAVTGVISAFVFRVLYLGGKRTDLAKHAELLVESRLHGKQLGYSGYYSVLGLVAGADLSAGSLLRATVLVLAVAVGCRMALAYLLFSATPTPTWVKLSVVAALFVAQPLAVLPGDLIYMGKFSPAIWHNSTSIFTLPVALLLVLVVCAYLSDNSPPRWMVVVAPTLVVLCGWMKPNFVLAFLPGLVLWAGVTVLAAPRTQRGGLVRARVVRLVPLVLAGAVVLGMMFISTFGGGGLYAYGQRLVLGVRPLAVWRALAGTGGAVLWSLVASFLTPLVALLAMGRRGLGSVRLQVVWATTIVAILEFTVLAEFLVGPGGRHVLTDGNWMWGAQMCTFVLYVVTAADLMRTWAQANAAKWLAAVGLGVQGCIGVVFFWRLLAGQIPTHIILFPK